MGLTDLDVMHYFIQGLRPDLKSHVILGQPKSLSEAENLANLKEVVLKHTSNFTQQKPESQLQSVVTSLERLTNAQQNNISNFATYNAHSHDFRYDQHHGGQSTFLSPRHDLDHLTKFVRDEVRRQTRFMAPTTRPSNSGAPSVRNRRTTDGLPICNKCDKVCHIARSCRSSGNPHATRPLHNQTFRPNAPAFRPNAPTFQPNAPTFVNQQRTNNPFYQQLGN